MLSALQEHASQGGGGRLASHGCTLAREEEALGEAGVMLGYLLYSWHTGFPLVCLVAASCCAVKLASDKLCLHTPTAQNHSRN